MSGFAYAARQVWGDDYSPLFFCDNNKFCQQVLKKNFGRDILIYDDIRLVSRGRFIADTDGRGQEKQEKQAAGDKQCGGTTPNSEGRKSGKQTERERRENISGGDFAVDLLTGGFPCQPFSQAGKRRGTNDDRFLWPEMLRVIKEFAPRWIVAENVRGITNIENGMVFEQVCLDLESTGYEVQAFVIPAVAVDAPHRRDRVWFVAHSEGNRNRGIAREIQKTDERQKSERQEKRICALDNANSDACDSVGSGQSGNSRRWAGDEPKDGFIQCEQDAPDSETERLQRTNPTGRGCSDGRDAECFRLQDWDEPWIEVATRTCSGRVDDGLPVELDGFKLTKAGHRVERLKALGNAIVPKLAMEIMKAIKEIEL